MLAHMRCISYLKTRVLEQLTGFAFPRPARPPHPTPPQLGDDGAGDDEVGDDDGDDEVGAA